MMTDLHRGLLSVALVFSTTLSPLLPGAEESEPKPSDSEEAKAVTLPPGVVARVNGRDILLDEYVRYLLATIGKSRLDDYLDRLLVDEEARRLGLAVEPEAVESAVADRIERVVKSQYRGDEGLYERALSRRRRTVEEEKMRLRQEMYYELILGQVIREGRKIGEAEVRAEFEKRFGEGGIEYTLRHILVSTRPLGPGPTEGATGGDAADAARGRTPGEARARTEKIVREIQDGLDFVEAVRKYSDDGFTRRNDGRLPRYRKSFFGEKFHAEVSSLTPENPVSGVIESPRGYHIVLLVEKQVTRLEDVRKDVEAALRKAPPSPRERQALIRALRAKARVEGL